MTQKTTAQPEKALHRRFEGEVVKVSGEKTISVLVKTTKTHPKYRKQYVVSKKYAVHDQNNTAKEGDTVVFEECRPLSKNKRWRLVKVVA